MALHMLSSAPSFTVSLRGYDKEEVDEYVEELCDSREVDAEALADAVQTIARLDTELARLGERANDLEACLRSETPRSIFALGQRLTLILEEAEDAATETVSQATEEAGRLLAEADLSAETTLRDAARQTEEAETRAQELLRSAEERAAVVTRDADNNAAAVTRAAELSALGSEEECRRKVESMLADAESRANARAEEMEAWAHRMHAHLRLERDRAAEEFTKIWGERQDDLAVLAGRRADLMAGLDRMHDALAELLADAGDAVEAHLTHSTLPGGDSAELDGPQLDGPEVMAPTSAVVSEPALAPAPAGSPAAHVVEAGDVTRDPAPLAEPAPGFTVLTGNEPTGELMLSDRAPGVWDQGPTVLGRSHSEAVPVEPEGPQADELDSWAATWKLPDLGG